MKDLKINIIIKNNILKLEFIDILISFCTIYIENCDIIISIFIKFRSSFQIRSMHAIKIVILSSHFEMHVLIQSIESLSNKNYLFESIEINFLIYAHLFNSNTKTIIIRNDSNKFIKIYQNFRLNKIIKINYINAYITKIEKFKLILRVFKFIHKFF